MNNHQKYKEDLVGSKKKVLVCITTGRVNFKETLNMFEESIILYGLERKFDITLGINYDITYASLSPDDFLYDSKIGLPILYFDDKFRIEQEEKLRKYTSDIDLINTLSQRSGYGAKRNLILLFALEENYDKVIFLDDDELPFTCLGAGDELLWHYTNNIEALCSCNENVFDISVGFLTGYDTTIPPSIDKYLGKPLAKQLASVISIGSDVIKEDSFLNTELFFLKPKTIPKEVEVLMENGGKWFGGGNICFNVPSLRKGLLPAYYTPQSGRGEDTIYSTKLQGARVWRARSGIFHDAFLEYTELIKVKSFPIKQLKSIDSKEEYYIKRFSEALYGWIAYTPLFLSLTDPDSYAEKVEIMIKGMQSIDDNLLNAIPKLKEKFGNQKPSETLLRFHQINDKQIEKMNSADNLFREICTKI